MSGRPRALLELLRAPLLLSPVADVLAGAAVSCAGAGAWRATARGLPFAWPFGAEGGRRIALAAAVGCCLLAAGMTLNALVDLPEDRLRKPQRPLPRGDLTPGFARGLYAGLTALALALAVALAASGAGSAAVGVALLIALVTALYHTRIKRRRVAGCLLLGSARGLDLLLGAAAFAGRLDPGALAAAALYALYMTGASLHASTDDEPEPGPWSRLGLGLSSLALLATLAAPLAGRLGGGDPSAAFAVALALLALARLLRAAAIRPPPAITGVALSGLYGMLAALALSVAPPAARLPTAALALLLFVLSRLLFRAFPPT